MLAALVAFAAPIQTIRLDRGSQIAGYGAFVAVEDTCIVREQPDRNFGGDYTLRAGPNAAILIRFRDLRGVLGPHPKVRKASLVLTIDTVGEPQFERIGSVIGGWFEGPMLVQGKKVANGEPTTGATWKQRRLNVTASPWAEAGAAGADDVRWIPEAKASRQGDTVVISGLEKAVQEAVDRPWDDNGFEVRFRNECAFASSQSMEGRPALEIEFETGPASTGVDLAVTSIEPVPGQAEGPFKYVARVVNQGNQAARGMVTRWTVADRRTSSLETSKSLAPGASTEFQITVTEPAGGTDHRLSTLAFSVEPNQPDANPSDNGLEISRSARPLVFKLPPSVDWQRIGYADAASWQVAAVGYLNQVVLPQSRFSLAPDGSLERFRATAARDAGAITIDLSREPISPAWRYELVRGLVSAYGLPTLPDAIRDPFAGSSGLGDTRFDGAISPFIPISYEQTGSNPLMAALGMPTGLLAAHEVATIEDSRIGGPANLPSIATVKLLMPDGTPLSQAEVALFDSAPGALRPDVPYATVTTDGNGVLTLPARGVPPANSPLGEFGPGTCNKTIEMRVSGNGQTEFLSIRGWQIMDAFRRTRLPIVSLEKRVSLAPPNLATDQNLATGRLVTDSVGTPGDKLAALVDGNVGTSAPLPEATGSFVEIDLGRDRMIGEIQIVTDPAAMWNQFDVVLYSTGQDGAAAVPWAREVDWRNSAISKGVADSGKRRITYRSGSGRYRFVRIVNRGPAQKAEIGELRVVPVKS